MTKPQAFEGKWSGTAPGAIAAGEEKGDAFVEDEAGGAAVEEELVRKAQAQLYGQWRSRAGGRRGGERARRLGGSRFGGIADDAQKGGTVYTVMAEEFAALGEEVAQFAADEDAADVDRRGEVVHEVTQELSQHYLKLQSPSDGAHELFHPFDVEGARKGIVGHNRKGESLERTLGNDQPARD